jgi:SAM-dependent methyltransferase
LLNRLTGLEDQVTVQQGSALNLPYTDDSFAVVWMQNVGMNIENKPRLYEEIARVLKPGGRFAFQEVAAGQEATTIFPLPWASTPTDNHLLSINKMLSMLGEYGFSTTAFEDVSDSQNSRSATNSTPTPDGQLGLAVYVDNLAEKAGNARRCLEQRQIRYVRGVFQVR